VVDKHDRRYHRERIASREPQRPDDARLGPVGEFDTSHLSGASQIAVRCLQDQPIPSVGDDDGVQGGELWRRGVVDQEVADRVHEKQQDELASERTKHPQQRHHELPQREVVDLRIQHGGDRCQPRTPPLARDEIENQEHQQFADRKRGAAEIGVASFVRRGQHSAPGSGRPKQHEARVVELATGRA